MISFKQRRFVHPSSSDLSENRLVQTSLSEYGVLFLELLTLQQHLHLGLGVRLLLVFVLLGRNSLNAGYKMCANRRLVQFKLRQPNCSQDRSCQQHALVHGFAIVGHLDRMIIFTMQIIKMKGLQLCGFGLQKNYSQSHCGDTCQKS